MHLPIPLPHAVDLTRRLIATHRKRCKTREEDARGRAEARLSKSARNDRCRSIVRSNRPTAAVSGRDRPSDRPFSDWSRRRAPHIRVEYNSSSFLSTDRATSRARRCAENHETLARHACTRSPSPRFPEETIFCSTSATTIVRSRSAYVVRFACTGTTANDGEELSSSPWRYLARRASVLPTAACATSLLRLSVWIVHTYVRTGRRVIFYDDAS